MDYERRLARMAMHGVPERLGLQFARGDIEMRAKPNGSGGTAFSWLGYATVYDAPFEMWDQAGERFEERVAPHAARRSVNSPDTDVPFLIGHNSAGIPLARTKSGTMRLADDSRGVLVDVPSMDGRREEVRALASAVERGDMDEMSLAFICTEQQWDRDYETRTILAMDLHRGDVCAVVHGANPATSGAAMVPVEQLALRRPVAIGAPVLLERLSVPQAERDRAKAAGNSLPDGSYPINNASQLHSAAVLAASHHGDWKAAQALIRRRAKELGVDVTTLPGFGEEKSDGRPVELRASAADDINLANAPDYDPAATSHEAMTGTHAHGHSDYQGGTHSHEHAHDGDASHGHSHGESAAVEVDDSTGIPGPESQLSAGRRLELRLRELELAELARGSGAHA